MNGPRSFSFRDKLVASLECAGTDDVEVIVKKLFPSDVKKVWRATEIEDRSGVDYWGLLANGEKLGIDLKTRPRDFGKKDWAVEWWSAYEQRKKGWTIDVQKKAWLILYFCLDTQRAFVAPSIFLRTVALEFQSDWRSKYHTAAQYTRPEWAKGKTVQSQFCEVCQKKHMLFSGGWHSKCTFVPENILMESMGALATFQRMQSIQVEPANILVMPKPIELMRGYQTNFQFPELVDEKLA